MWNVLIGMVCGLGMLGITSGGPEVYNDECINNGSLVVVEMPVCEGDKMEAIDMYATKRSVEILGWEIIEEDYN